MAHLRCGQIMRLIRHECWCSRLSGGSLPHNSAGTSHPARSLTVLAHSNQPGSHTLLTVRPELTVLPARQKTKKAAKGKAATHKVPDFEVEGVVDLEAYQEQMRQHLEELKTEYIHNLAVNTSAASFESLQVKTADGVFPLNQIAMVIQKSPSLVIIDMQRTPQYLQDVTKTLKKSQVSQNPQQSSPTSLAIQIPKVSREKREMLAKSAKTLLNSRKAKLNRVYDQFSKEVLKETSKKDLLKTVLDKLLQIKKDTETKAEEMMKAKQDELLQENK